MHQPELPLIDPTEPRVLPQDGDLWFAVCRYADDRMRQRCYRLALIEPTLRACRSSLNTYLSQGTFTVPTRRSVHLAWLTHGFGDLDIYKSDRWRGLTHDDMVREIIWHCADAGIPPPSIILFSGRGYYPKWFWSQPVPRAEAGRALAINRQLCRSLTPFQADPNACDLSRILRVVGTINSKSDKPVEIVWINGPPGEPTTYDFNEFAHDLARPTIEDMQAEAGEEPRFGVATMGLRESRRILDRQDRGYTFSREAWHWGVLEDLRSLAAARYPGGIVAKGNRDLFGHLAACQIARVIRPGPLFHEIIAICREFLPADYADGAAFRRHCSTLLDRAMWAAEGQLVDFEGRQRTPIYTYSKARLIDTLRIEPAEMRDLNLTRLIDGPEKRRRETVARRARGIRERTAYLAPTEERRAAVAALAAEGHSQREIAARLNMSQSEVNRLWRHKVARRGPEIVS